MVIRTLLLLCLISATARAEVYKWTDVEGRAHFGDQNLGQSKAEVVQVKVNSYQHVSYSAVVRVNPVANEKRVVLYGTSWCGYCKKAKRYFQEKGIAYTYLDIEINAQAKINFDAMGGEGVPVILVGDKRMNGFSEEGFQQIYR